MERKLDLPFPPSYFISLFCDWTNSITDAYSDYKIMGDFGYSHPSVMKG
jgi:hypothetical protein